MLVGRATPTMLQEKIKRSKGILCKLHYFLNKKNVTNPLSYLSEAIIKLLYWGNAYKSILKPLFTSKKKDIRIITFPASLNTQLLECY